MSETVTMSGTAREQDVADNAVRESDTAATAAWIMRGRQDSARAEAREPEPVIAFKPQRREPVQDGQSGASQRDWSSALDLIQEATEAIRISEERSHDLEQEMQQMAAQARERTRLLEAQIAMAERRTEKAEERARHAEKRASEAEEWLSRLHDAIVTGFSRKPIDDGADGSAEALSLAERMSPGTGSDA